MLIFTLTILCMYVCFQLAYILIPMFTIKKDKKNNGLTTTTNPISILVPAYNEELVIKNSIEAIRKIDYTDYETIIINDGSKDNTMQILTDYLDLEPCSLEKAGKLPHKEIRQVYKSRKFEKMVVIDKENGGKADSLNAGIEYASSEIVLTIDADSMLAHDSLGHINSAFQNDEVIAAGGTVHIAQGIKKEDNKIIPTFNIPGLVRFQVMQYLNSFFLRKKTQSMLGAIIVIAGAFGAFKKKILQEVGGYRSTVGEDMDITLKIQRLIKQNKKKYKITYVPEAFCYTECPEDLNSLLKQRFRWQRAFIDCVFYYWDGFLSNFKSTVSMFFFLDFFILGTLTAFSSIFVFAQLLLNRSNYEAALIILGITMTVAVIQNLLALYSSKKYGYKYSFIDYVKIVLFFPLDLCFYRFLGIVFTTAGTISYFFSKNHWGSAARIGKSSIV